MADSSDRVSRRGFLEATGGAAAAIALAGCSGEEQQATDSPTQEGGGETEATITTSGEMEMSTPTEGGEGTETETETPGEQIETGGTLQRTWDYAMDTLDPAVSIYYNVQEFIGQIHDELVMDIHGTLSLQNKLATDYEVSEDGKTYTFHLREGVKFHNGDTFTADDYVYVFERLAASKNSRKAYILFDNLGVVHETETVDGEEQYKPGSLAVEAVDDHTFRFTLETPYYSTLNWLAQEIPFAALPEGLVDDVPGYDGEMTQKEFANNPVGLGPFEFVKREPGTEAEVKRFDDYYGEKAKVDGVHWQILTDSNALYNYGQNKNTDTPTIPTAKYDPDKISIDRKDDLGREIGTYGPLRNGETVNYMSVPGLGNTIITINTKRIKKPIRQAIAYVLNQKLVVEQAYKGRAQPATHVTPPGAFPGGPSGYDKHGEKYPYGVNKSMMDKARSLVQEAGYSTDNPREMQFSVWQTSSAEQMANLLRDQLKAVGINLSVKVAPASQYWGRAATGNFDMYLSGWGMSIPDPATILDILYPPNQDLSQPGALEYAQWSGTEASQRAKKAWERAQNNPKPTEEDAKVRARAWKTMEEANWEDVAIIPLLHSLYEWFWYDWLHQPLMGPVGYAKMRWNHAWLEDRG